MATSFLFTLLLLIFPITCSNETTKVTNCDGGDRGTTNLWRISTDPPSYFFGTVHVPATRVWPGISEEAKSAFQSADKAYFELGKFSLDSPLFVFKLKDSINKKCSLVRFVKSDYHHLYTTLSDLAGQKEYLSDLASRTLPETAELFCLEQ